MPVTANIDVLSGESDESEEEAGRQGFFPSIWFLWHWQQAPPRKPKASAKEKAKRKKSGEVAAAKAAPSKKQKTTEKPEKQKEVPEKAEPKSKSAAKEMKRPAAAAGHEWWSLTEF